MYIVYPVAKKILGRIGSAVAGVPTPSYLNRRKLPRVEPNLSARLLVEGTIAAQKVARYWLFYHQQEVCRLFGIFLQ
jgi:hypothetical protein